MSSTKLIRWSGWALILGGVLLATGPFTHPPADTAVYALYPLWVPAHLFGGIALLLIALGLVGLYARQLEKVGSPGLIGFILTFVGSTLTAGTLIFIDVVVFPFLAARGLDWLDTPNGALRTSSTFQLAAGLGAISLLLGLLTLTLSTLRARVLPRLGAWLIILSIPLGIVGGVILSLVGAVSQEILQTLFGGVFSVIGLGLAAWGWALWSEKREMVAQVSPAM